MLCGLIYARPIAENGQAKLDAKLYQAREDAIVVKPAIDGGSIAVLILGGAHDRSDNVPNDCQYKRVATMVCAALAGK